MPFTMQGADIKPILSPTTDYHRFETGFAKAIEKAAKGIVYGSGQLKYSFSYPEARYKWLFVEKNDDQYTFKTNSVPEVAQVLADLFTHYWNGAPIANGVSVSGQQFDSDSIAASNALAKTGLIAALTGNKSKESDVEIVAAAIASALTAAAALITTSHVHTDPKPPVPFPKIPIS